MSDTEFLGKIDWEGGVLGALEYGLRADMLTDPTSELGTLWKSLEKAWRKFEPTLNLVEGYVDDMEEEL